MKVPQMPRICMCMAEDSTFACVSLIRVTERLSRHGNLSYQIDSWLRLNHIEINVFLLSVPYEAVTHSYQNMG